MTELDFLNFVTSKIAAQATLIQFDSSKIKYPNTEVDESNASNFVEILVTYYPGVKLNLKGNKRLFGCVTFRVVSSRGEGLADSIALAQNFAACLSGLIDNGIVFDEFETKILSHTLSQTQTTTDIPYNQVNANVEFSYVR